MSGTRTAPPRHQRLRSTLDWSYELLDADEQLVFDRLAVFAGGWSLEAAEAVCAGDGLLEPHAVLQFVASLVEKSLVIAEPGAGGTVRYGLLETLRQYAHQHLVERDLVDRARASHAAFFLNVAERLETELEGPRRRPSLDELEREHDNLRAALRWFIDQDKSTEAAQRLGAALGLFWFFQGHLHEGRAWLAQLLAVTTPATRPETRARLLYGTGLLAQFQGDYAAAQPALEECLAIQRDVGDPLQIARSLQLLGQLAWMRSQFDVAGDFLEEALELARTAEDPFLEALIRRGLGDVALAGGDLDTAWTSAEQALALARPAGASTTTCQALRILGEVSHRHGDLPAARSFLEASLETGRQVGEGFWVASILPRLARVALDEGDAAQAAALLEESLGLFHGLGDRVNLARVSAELEQVVAVQRRPGDSAEASRSARPYALTPREREVGTLIARGLSNRQIAAQLVIAEKTAANHVARILDKLDLHSRAALAARAADLGLVAAHS